MRAFIFPGQGSQAVGMGSALARNETRYAPSSGIPDLRAAILEKVRTRNGIPAEAESPIVVNGGMHGADQGPLL